MFRDKNFDIKEMFGIEIDDSLNGKNMRLGEENNNSPIKSGGNIASNGSYLVRNRVKEIEKI